METVPFQQVVYGIAQRDGKDPSRELYEPYFGQLVSALNRQIEHAWRQTWWPDWTLFEQRTSDSRRFIPFNVAAAAAWSGATTYDLGDIVSLTGLYYRSLADDNLNKDPETETDYWEEISPIISRLKTVTRRDPGLYYENPWPSDYARGAGGIYLAVGEPVTVWLTFQTPAPVFTNVLWSATASYSVGDVRYHPTSRECYRALQASTNKVPDAEADYWVAVDFPAVLETFVQRAVFADLLRVQKQPVRAAQEAAEATAALARAVQTELPDQGLHRRAEVRLYSP